MVPYHNNVVGRNIVDIIILLSCWIVGVSRDNVLIRESVIIHNDRDGAAPHAVFAKGMAVWRYGGRVPPYHMV